MDEHLVGMPYLVLVHHETVALRSNDNQEFIPVERIHQDTVLNFYYSDPFNGNYRLVNPVLQRCSLFLCFWVHQPLVSVAVIGSASAYI